MDDDLLVRLRERADARDLAREYLEPVATLLREAAAEIERLRLQLERDARTYATMRAGMESQAELADGLKQRCRVAENKAAGFDALVAAMGSLSDTADAPDPTVESLLDWIGRAKVAEAEVERLRAAAARALEWLDGRPDDRAGDKEAARALRAALGPGVTPTTPTAGDNADNDNAE